MQNQYNANQAVVCRSNFSASSIMQSTSVETIKSILGRLGVSFVEGLPKDVYISALKEEFCSERKWILKMLPSSLLDFLLEVWEQKEVAVDQERWDYMQYLKIFGILGYKRGNPVVEEANEIYVIQEMKENFYFLLKSKKSKLLIREYDEWEKIMVGLLYYYGFIEIPALYEQFINAIKKIIPYQDFFSFLNCRCSLWSFGAMLKDLRGEHEYFQNLNVENSELILMYIREHPELSYKKIEKDDLIFIGEAGGIDNRWPGVIELATLFTEEMNMNYYRVTVFVKTLVVMIQNSADIEEVLNKMTLLSFEKKEWKEKAEQAVRQLYEYVPIFEFKGYSRWEYNKMFHEKQLKKKRELFKIIDGGKI